MKKEPPGSSGLLRQLFQMAQSKLSALPWREESATKNGEQMVLAMIPIFYLPEYGCSSAEISMEEKNKISHRGKALCAIKDQLR